VELSQHRSRAHNTFPTVFAEVKVDEQLAVIRIAATIANALYHATGKCVRDLPVTLDKLRQ
jgi:CO/xanthine dehydrogenase Mo-binding subunit